MADVKKSVDIQVKVTGITKADNRFKSLANTLTVISKTKAFTRLTNRANNSVNAVKNVSGALKEVQTSLSKIGSSIALRKLRAFKELNQPINRFSTSLNQVNKKIVSIGKTRSFTSLSRKIKKVITQSNKLYASFEQLRVKLNDLGVSNGLDELNKKSSKLDDTLKKFNTTVKQTGKTMKGSADKADKLEDEVDDLGRKAKKTSNIFETLGHRIKTVFQFRAISGGILAITGALESGVQAIVDYDQALKDLQAITGATDLQVGDMGEKILQVANDTKFSADEIAEGMRIIGQAGFSAEDSIDAIDGIANLATGTLSDMGTTVDLVTTALKVFNLEANETSTVADVFATAVNRSKLTIDKLTTAMNYIGPIAQNAGISLQETTAAMMILANTGQRASKIGTGLRRVFADMIKPSKKLEGSLRSVGMSINDINPRVVGFATAVENLEKVVDGAGDAFEFFGKRGASAVLALIRNQDDFEKFTDAFEVSGQAASMAAIQMKGLGVSIKNMQDKAKNLAIAIGRAGLIDIMKAVVDVTRELTVALTELVNSRFGPLIVKSTAAAVAIGAIVLSAGAFYAILGKLYVLIRPVIGLISRMAAALLTVKGAIVAVVGALAVFTAAAFSPTIRGWIMDFELFGVRVGSVLQYILNGFKHVSTSVSIFGVTLQDVFGVVKMFFEEFAGFIDQKLTALAKLPVIIASLILEFHPLLWVLEKFNPAYKGWADGLRALVEEEQRASAIRHGANAVTERTLQLEHDLAQVAAEVTKEHQEQAKALDKAFDDLAANLEKTKVNMQDLRDKGSTSIENLAKVVDAQTKAIWKGLVNNEVITDYKAQLSEIANQTYLTGDEMEARMHQIGNQMGISQIGAYRNALNAIESIYDEQLVLFQKSLDSETESLIAEGYEQDDIRKNASKKAAEYALDVLDKKKSYYAKATTALQTQLDKAIEREKGYAEDVKKIQEDIRLFKMDSEERLREVARKGMSEEAALNDRRLEYFELMRKGHEALRKGEIEPSIELFKRAASATSDFSAENIRGINKTSEQYNKLKKAHDAISQAQDKNLKATKANQLESTDLIQSTRLALKDLHADYERLNVETNKQRKIIIDIDKSQVERAIKELEKETEIYLDTKIKFEQAEQAIKDFDAMLKKHIEEKQYKVRVEGEADIRRIIDSVDGLQKKLQDDMLVKVKGDKGLNETEARIATIMGYMDTLNTAAATKVKMDSSDVVTSTELTRELTKELQGLPGVPKPLLIELEPLVNNQEDVDKLVESVSEEKLPRKFGIDISFPNILDSTERIKKLYESITKLPEERNVIINIVENVTRRYANSPSSSSPTPTTGELELNSGGGLPGFGGGDIVPALLEPGEWVIRKEAVKKYGHAFMSRLNAGLMGIIPKFQTGGKVGNFLSGFTDGMNTGSDVSYTTMRAQNEIINFYIADLIRKLNLGGDPFHKAPAFKESANLKRLEEYLRLYKRSGKGDKSYIEKAIDAANTYQDMGGVKKWERMRKQYIDDVRRQEDIPSVHRGRKLTRDEVLYAEILSMGVSFDDEIKKKMGAQAKDEKAVKSLMSSSKSQRAKFNLLGALSDKRFRDLENTHSARFIKRQKGGPVDAIVQKFQTGGEVLGNVFKGISSGGKAISHQLNNLNVPGVMASVPRLSDGGSIAQTIKHSVDFNIGNRTVGPFEGNPMDINLLVDQLNRAKMRA